MRSVTLVLAMVCLLAPSGAKVGPHTSSVTAAAAGKGTGSNTQTTTAGTAGHHGPYEEVGKEIKDSKKRASFFTLIKKLREVKNGDGPELQRNATRKALNEEMHTLVGDGIMAKYQAVHRRQAQNYKNLKKDVVAPKRSPSASGVGGSMGKSGAGASKTSGAASHAATSSSAAPKKTSSTHKKKSSTTQ